MIFKIAWRNIWRNKRRTSITIASIFFAILFSVASDAINRGVFDGMIDSTVGFYSGYVQVLKKGYWDDRTLDKSFELTDALEAKLKATKGVDNVVPRLESFALVSSGKTTKSSMIIGIDPEKENQLTNLKKRIIEGVYLEAEDQAVLLGEALAKKLKLSINDTVVLISQGYHGVNAAGKYPVKGIVSFGSPELNSKVVYMPLKVAQYFYGATSLVTAAVLDVRDKNASLAAVSVLENSLDLEEYEYKDWKEMMPEIMSMKQSKEAGNLIMMFVLYIIISFGIFGTILMMTEERRYEFGILLSVGMKRSQLALTTWIETIFLGMMGAVVGIGISYALMYYLHVNPIKVTGDLATTYEKFGIEPLLPASIDWDIFAKQAVTVFFVTGILALYPCIKIFKMKPVDAMRR
jgi:putative ABC transport system permease protein